MRLLLLFQKELEEYSQGEDFYFDNYDNDGVCPVCKAPEHDDVD